MVTELRVLTEAEHAEPFTTISTATDLDDTPEEGEAIIITCGDLAIKLWPEGDGFAHQHGGAFPAIGSDSLAALYALIQCELAAARDLTQVRKALTA